MAIDNWLRAQMASRQMTQRMLAKRSGIEHSTISRLVRGRRGASHETVAALYGVFLEECPKCGGSSPNTPWAVTRIPEPARQARDEQRPSS